MLRFIAGPEERSKEHDRILNAATVLSPYPSALWPCAKADNSL